MKTEIIHNRMSAHTDNERSEAAVDVPRLVRHLDSAHAELVAARKIAALSKHESYEEIGDAIECVEAAFIWLHSQPNERGHAPTTQTPQDHE